MMKKLLEPFNSESIHKIIIHFYEIYKLSLIFSVFNIPWIILNLSIKYKPLTSFLYLIVGLIVCPNLLALFYGIQRILSYGQQSSLKEYWRMFLVSWKQQDKGFWGCNLVTASLLSIYFVEFDLIMQHSSLRFMIIPFMILGVFFLATIIYFLLINIMDDSNHSKLSGLLSASLLSWRNLFSSAILALLLMLWLSLGYYAPIINVLIGNGLIFWLIYKFRYRMLNQIMVQK